MMPAEMLAIFCGDYLFDSTGLMNAKEKYEEEIVKLRNIVLEKLKDVDFLKQFDWKLHLISCSVSCAVPEEWDFFPLIETRSYPQTKLGLDEPFQDVAVWLHGGGISLIGMSHDERVKLSTLLGADMSGAIPILKMWIKNTTADLKRTDIGDVQRKEMRKDIKEDKSRLKEILKLQS